MSIGAKHNFFVFMFAETILYEQIPINIHEIMLVHAFITIGLFVRIRVM